MKNILCFGDSNTWGYDPVNDCRYDFEKRWTGILSKQLSKKAHVYEAGIPDMTFGWESPTLPDRNGIKVCNAFLTAAMPLDLMVITLGTNDTKNCYHAGPEEISIMAENLIKKTLGHEWADDSGMEILLVCPVPMDQRAAELFKDNMSMDSVKTSQRLHSALERTALRCGVHFADAGEWNVTLCMDGCHYTGEGHKNFADGIERTICRLLGFDIKSEKNNKLIKAEE